VHILNEIILICLELARTEMQSTIFASRDLGIVMCLCCRQIYYNKVPGNSWYHFNIMSETNKNKPMYEIDKIFDDDKVGIQILETGLRLQSYYY